MIIFKNITALIHQVEKLKSKGLNVGFVPTMGALHQGHLSLINDSKKRTDITVASIFVNPTQFNDAIDFEKYPATLESDLLLLEKHHCDIVFIPAIDTIYPNGFEAKNDYDFGPMETLLEGKFRPGHFKGVAQVVHRLLQIVKPDYLFLGQKDFQQCMVIKQLVKQLNLPITVVTGSTFRETTGLAMSSRNLRLTDDERTKATAISKLLSHLKSSYAEADYRTLENEGVAYLLNNGFTKVDYVQIADTESLQPADASKKEHLVALVAAYMGDVRLIDNMLLAD